MQIVCPDCTTSYEISAAALGHTGRMVRCTHCSHQWFVQAADLVEAAAGRGDTRIATPNFEERHRADTRFEAPAHRDAGYDAAPAGWADPAGAWSVETSEPDDVVQFAPNNNDDVIEFAPPPEVDAIDDAPATSPEHQGDEMAPAGGAALRGGDAEGDGKTPDFFELQRRRKKRGKASGAEKTGLITPVRLIAAFAAVLVLLVFERFNIVRLMPQTASLYAAVGLPINLRGLVFEDVKTTTEMQDSVPVLVIEGTIRNITNANADVPRLRFAMRNNAGADIYSWTAVPERTQLTPGGVMGFRTRLASPPSESRNAYVRFVQRRDLVSTSH